MTPDLCMQAIQDRDAADVLTDAMIEEGWISDEWNAVKARGFAMSFARNVVTCLFVAHWLSAPWGTQLPKPVFTQREMYDQLVALIESGSISLEEGQRYLREALNKGYGYDDIWRTEVEGSWVGVDRGYSYPNPIPPQAVPLVAKVKLK